MREDSKKFLAAAESFGGLHQMIRAAQAGDPEAKKIFAASTKAELAKRDAAWERHTGRKIQR